MAYSKQNFQNGQILNAANLEAMENGIIAGQGVHNLLDNSDFTNPVNQRGQTSYTGAVYTIDRWKLSANTLNVGSDGITLVASDSSSAVLTQYISDLRDGVYTQALNVNGTIYTRIIQFSGSTITTIDNSNAAYTGGYVNCTVSNSGDFYFHFRVNAGYSATVRWAALYEGSYNADTLPNYKPKDKHIEMLNCDVPLHPKNLLDNSDFRSPINYNGLGEYSGYLTDTINRWYIAANNVKVIVQSNSIKAITTVGSAYASLGQKVRDIKKYAGKTLTFAAYIMSNVVPRIIIYNNDSSIVTKEGTSGKYQLLVCSFSVPSNVSNNAIEVRVQGKSTQADDYMEAQWAALYEGAYTASALPPYVPKGKHVEMLNCGVPLTPHNLLDNSDFRNPVNQRGKTSYPGEASKLTYTIDRWNIWDTHAKTEVTASGLKITGIDVMGYVAQLFEKPDKMIGKTYTLAAGMSNGTIICGTATVPSTTQTEEYYISAIASSDTTPGLRLQVAGNLSKVRFQLSVKPGKTYIIAWAALYEGSYDASTLPAYQPKGYAAELAECQRYYENSWFGTNKSSVNEYFATPWNSIQADARIEFKQHKRISPTITLYPEDSDAQWRIYSQGNYYIAASADPVKRNGLSGFIVRITKGDSDASTWTVGSTIQARGHWEASADL